MNHIEPSTEQDLTEQIKAQSKKNSIAVSELNDTLIHIQMNLKNLFDLQINEYEDKSEEIQRLNKMKNQLLDLLEEQERRGNFINTRMRAIATLNKSQDNVQQITVTSTVNPVDAINCKTWVN